MSKTANERELARERANNLVRAVEAAKSSRHSLSLVNMYAGDGELGPYVERAVVAIELVETILRRKQNGR